MKFSKSPLTYQEQIELLTSRGMRIDNKSLAKPGAPGYLIGRT